MISFGGVPPFFLFFICKRARFIRIRGNVGLLPRKQILCYPKTVLILSNASINKPGGMGGLSSTRDTMSYDFPLESSLHWGWLSSRSTCMAMFAAFPSTIMEAAFGRLHNSGGPPSAAPHCCGIHNGGWEKIGKAANIAIQVIPDESHPQ